MIKLETERLFLRQYEPKDLPRFHKLLSDKENMYYLDDVITNSIEESQKVMESSIRANAAGKARRFCIALKESDELIGAVGYEIRGITPIGKIIDPIGWFCLPEYQNNGYITEAVKKAVEYAFLHDNCIRIVTACYKDNAPTQRVMAKAGFRLEAEKPDSKWHDGRMKTRLEYAINRDEFEQRRN